MKNGILFITLIATLAQSLCATNKLNHHSNTFSRDLTKNELNLLIQQALHEGLITQDVAEQLDPTTIKTATDKSNPNKKYYLAGGAIASILVIAGGYYLYTDFIQNEKARVAKLARKKALKLAKLAEQELLSKKEQAELNAGATALHNSLANQPLQEKKTDTNEKKHDTINTAANIALEIVQQHAGFSTDEQLVAQNLTNIAIDLATGNHSDAIEQATDLVTNPQAIQHVAQELHKPLSNAAHTISNAAHQAAEAMSHLFHKKPKGHRRGILDDELEEGEIYEG